MCVETADDVVAAWKSVAMKSIDAMLEVRVWDEVVMKPAIEEIERFEKENSLCL
jgi:hypothetical protein